MRIGRQSSTGQGRMQDPLAATVGNNLASSMLAPGGAVNTSSLMLEYEKDELCEIHDGEVNIAIDEKNPEVYGCNKCVFEKKLLRPRFLVTAAKRVKKRIDLQYADLVKNLEEFDNLDPATFMQRF